MEKKKSYHKCLNPSSFPFLQPPKSPPANIRKPMTVRMCKIIIKKLVNTILIINSTSTCKIIIKKGFNRMCKINNRDRLCHTGSNFKSSI